MGFESEDLDPVDKKMRELDTRIAQFEEYQSQQQIEREVSRLQSKYSDFDITEVVQAAIKAGTNDLEAVYKQIAFDRFSKQKELETAASQQKQLQESKVVESKRQAAVVEGGASATSSTTNDSFESINSISDAWAAAKRQLNANF
jgi:(p)ppGpp synthase/HD superfamily hydrolase